MVHRLLTMSLLPWFSKLFVCRYALDSEKFPWILLSDKMWGNGDEQVGMFHGR